MKENLWEVKNKEYGINNACKEKRAQTAPKNNDIVHTKKLSNIKPFLRVSQVGKKSCSVNHFSDFNVQNVKIIVVSS